MVFSPLLYLRSSERRRSCGSPWESPTRRGRSGASIVEHDYHPPRRPAERFGRSPGSDIPPALVPPTYFGDRAPHKAPDPRSQCSTHICIRWGLAALRLGQLATPHVPVPVRARAAIFPIANRETMVWTAQS